MLEEVLEKTKRLAVGGLVLAALTGSLSGCACDIYLMGLHISPHHRKVKVISYEEQEKLWKNAMNNAVYRSEEPTSGIYGYPLGGPVPILTITGKYTKRSK